MSSTSDVDEEFKQLQSACLEAARAQGVDVLAVTRAVFEEQQTLSVRGEPARGARSDGGVSPLALEDDALFHSWDLLISHVPCLFILFFADFSTSL